MLQSGYRFLRDWSSWVYRRMLVTMFVAAREGGVD